MIHRRSEIERVNLIKNTPCNACGEPSYCKWEDGYPYCEKHIKRLRRNGSLETKYELSQKTMDNQIQINKDYAEIVVDKNNNRKILISLEDVELCKKHNWLITRRGYVYTWLGQNCVFLHRLILNPNADEIVDHIDRNTLNNTRSNLRIVNVSQNRINAKLDIRNKSGVTGVYYNKNRNKWIAFISINKKQEQLGYFNKLEDAIKVRKEAEVKYYGEYVPINRNN